MKNTRELILVALTAISIVGTGCAKKKAANNLPPLPTASTPSQSAVQTPSPRVGTPSRTAPSSATPASRYPDAATRARIDQLLAKIEDAYFDYDRHTLRPDAIKALETDSTELRDILKLYPDYKLTIEGHCDERGSGEYNMALGDGRSHAAKDYLVAVGIPSAQLSTVSYGKEQPVCQDHDEACWQRNRRIHIVALAYAQK